MARKNTNATAANATTNATPENDAMKNTNASPAPAATENVPADTKKKKARKAPEQDTTSLRISADDVAAMRAADEIAFRLDGGKGYVVCTKRLAGKGPFGGAVAAHEFEVNVRAVSADGAAIENAAASLDAGSVKDRKHLRTLSSLTKAEDILTLEFVADSHGSDALTAAGFVADSLVLHVKRDKKHRVSRSVLVGVKVAPVAERMIRF